jgi:protoheme IX farnesyltransferase
MLPVTHGMGFTGFHVWLYSIVLAATTLMPYAVKMSGLIYLGAAVVLNAVFLWHGWQLYKHYTDLAARKAFTWSIVYLSLLFAALLFDHYFRF